MRPPIKEWKQWVTTPFFQKNLRPLLSQAVTSEKPLSGKFKALAHVGHLSFICHTSRWCLILHVELVQCFGKAPKNGLWMWNSGSLDFQPEPSPLGWWNQQDPRLVLSYQNQLRSTVSNSPTLCGTGICVLLNKGMPLSLSVWISNPER